jgi:hypothetical protein
MNFSDYNEIIRLWDSVRIIRGVEYSLFTFGDSTLPYYLINDPSADQPLVTVRQGEIKITRAMIITPGSSRAEFENFFEEDQNSEMIEYFMSRTAAFSNLKLANASSTSRLVSDSTEEIIAKLNQQLDTEEEDRVAILQSPAKLSGMALFKYATERILKSAPDNITELREKGFLPDNNW